MGIIFFDFDTKVGKCKSFPSLFISIVKASQPIGSCSLFNQSIFGVDKDTPGAGSWGAEGKKPKYETQGSEYPGGSGSLTVTGAKDVDGAELTTAAEFAANDLVTYKYDKYSIDGIYFLDGELKMKSGAEATGAAPGTSAFTAEVSELKLSEVPATGGDAKDIAKIEFAATFKPTFAAGAAATVCGAIYDVVGTHAKVEGVTVKKAGSAGFAELAVASALGTTTTYPAGATAGLAMALIGPRWYK